MQKIVLVIENGEIVDVVSKKPLKLVLVDINDEMSTRVSEHPSRPPRVSVKQYIEDVTAEREPESEDRYE